MPEFKSKGEYEKWKSEKLKSLSDKEKQLKDTEGNISVQKNNKNAIGKNKIKWVAIISILSIIILGSLSYFYNYYSYSYQPRKIAEEYLKAIQLHDLEKIGKLCLSKDSILINLLDWKFVHKKSIPKKAKLDLSEEAWKKEIELQKEMELAVTAFQRVSGYSLPLPDLTKAEYKDYGVWLDNKLRIYKPFKEDGNYYYIMKPKIEYLLDITATNKLGTELKKKYILVLYRQGGKWNFDGDWKVLKFEERE